MAAGAGAPSYAVDVRTAAGPVSHLTGVTLDANNRFLLDPAHLSPGVTNWVRVKAEGSEGAVYSRAVRVVLNPAAVPGGENQIRAVSLSRSGTDLVVRWGLAAENGKKTRIYFKRSDNGAVTLLTQTALNAGVRSFTLSAQGLSSPCGDFHLGQVGPDDVESPLTPALFFAGIDLGIGHEGGCIGNPPPTPEPPKWADYYHARDHLGTLRLVTDISGYVQEAHDYEPFGLELVTSSGEPLGTLTTRKFTGHERDESTGLDYMLARYFSAGLSRFLSVDPVEGGADNPQSWNRYPYVLNNPMKYLDPNGEETTVFEDAAATVIDAGLAFQTFGDSLNNGSMLGVAADAALGTVGSLVQGAGDMLNIGSSMGETIGAGGSGEDYLRAGAAEAGRAGGIILTVTGAAGGARASSTTLTRTTISTADGAVSVPAGSVRSMAANGQGVVYRPAGSQGNAGAVRAASPNAQNPSGYARVYNQQGQPVNVQTGKPAPAAQTHPALTGSTTTLPARVAPVPPPPHEEKK